MLFTFYSSSEMVYPRSFKHHFKEIYHIYAYLRCAGGGFFYMCDRFRAASITINASLFLRSKIF